MIVHWQAQMIRAIKITCWAMLLAMPSQAIAELVPFIDFSATTDMGDQTNLSKTYDGSGLDVWPSVSEIHASTSRQNSWTSLSGTTTGTIEFELGDVKSIGGLAFWNRTNQPDVFSSATGINALVVQSSLDGSTFTLVDGSPTEFAQETGETASAQVFTWDPINAQYFRFVVGSNHGGSQTGFAENFFLANIPEPTSFVMFGVACMVMTRRRRQ